MEGTFKQSTEFVNEEFDFMIELPVVYFYTIEDPDPETGYPGDIELHGLALPNATEVENIKAFGNLGHDREDRIIEAIRKEELERIIYG